MKKNEAARIAAFKYIIYFVFITLISRVFYLQVVNGEYYRTLAEEKGRKFINEIAPRGEILDRNGNKLATNVQSFNITYNNVKSKADNDEINKVLLDTIRLIIKNGDEQKINTPNFPIVYENGIFKFDFGSSEKEINKKREVKFKEFYKLDEGLNAKESFIELANKFGLLDSYNNNKFIFKYNMTIDEALKLIAFRHSIQESIFSQYRAIYVAKNVSKKTALAVEYKRNNLPGIFTEISPIRKYPYGEVGSAFLGYLGKISEEEKDYYSSLGYDISRELIGKQGLEKALENNKELNIALRGEPGGIEVDVDKFGRILHETARLDSIPGDSVVTTIDVELQKVAEKALDETMENIRTRKIPTDEPYPNANIGAAVVVDVKTGEILALASRPGFDPNLFAEKGSPPKELVEYLWPQGRDFGLVPLPTFNYATYGTAPPGSTFKPLVAIAGLQEGVISPDTIIVDKGVYDGLPGFHRACWIWNEKRRTHGPVDVAKAIQVSCNYFFFEVGKRLGREKFNEWAYKFGLIRDPKTGEMPKTGIEIQENPGEVANPQKIVRSNVDYTMYVIKETLKNKYKIYTIDSGTPGYRALRNMLISGQYDENLLDSIGIFDEKAKKFIKSELNILHTDANKFYQILNASIGQGYTDLTPLQMASYVSTLVNGGTRYKLHLVKKVLNPDGTVKYENNPEVLQKLNLNPKYVEAVKEGMRKVTEEGGTASSTFRNFPIPTGGKTGSASVDDSLKLKGRAAYGWYIGFAPYDNPEIAVVVVIYNAGHGSYAAPVARAIYEQYFGLNKPATNSTNNTNSSSNNQLNRNN
ncbi:penicillin-binding transpeptidase domain-containing protein [Caloramator sp. CAR-1]|uniref:penicillin-binding transpeptidase domain-containing protein n=1 Tax=Caloramator sp. CAR-1 TaxID=3062777 RepID=UPI0026E293C5|nr:penicillin-binding transpeptidase domain-containing protein [Caloramator sp. CAR-1]MDO6355340.1 penicillin-binding transpeptidase domain-containing protein [Caloramator sp. CAR-1]